MILETERLIIREMTIKDAPFLLKLLNDPTWIQFIGDRNVHTIKDAENYIQEKMIDSYKKNGFGFYAVIDKNTNTSLGTTGLIDREGMEHIEVGFAFLNEFAGKGYAFESTKAMLNYAATILKINPIVAITDLDNIKSAKLLERLGLRFDKNIQLPDFKNENKLFVPIN